MSQTDDPDKSTTEQRVVDIDAIMQGESSVEKWVGTLKGANIDNWREERIEEILRKGNQ